MINKKNSLIIFLFAIIIVLLCLLAHNDKESVKVSNTNVTKNSSSKKKSDTIRTKFEQNENVVFFGDSITEFYPIEEIYDNNNIVKSGVSGYKTTDLLDNMEDLLYKYNPTKVIMLIGTNDILKDISQEQQDKTVDNIKKIYKEIRKNRPNAKLYIQSVYPINKIIDKDMVGNRTNDAIKKMNGQIKDFCNKENITYINMYDELVDEDGNLDKRYSDDGLHPSDLGYAKITRLLMPYVYE